MTEPEGCRPVYCVAGPCEPSCLRMDDPKPIEVRPDRLARTAARIREAREGLSDDRMPDIPLQRAADIYHGVSAPTARELALYAEACQVSVDWLLTGVTGTVADDQPMEAPQADTHVCPPGHLYVCPTALEVESSCHSGFSTCCGRPDLHIPLPDGPATDALSEALSEARKREYALQQELARWRPSHKVTHHTYEGPGPCRADLFGQTCDYPRDDHELVNEEDR